MAKRRKRPKRPGAALAHDDPGEIVAGYTMEVRPGPVTPESRERWERRVDALFAVLVMLYREAEDPHE